MSSLLGIFGAAGTAGGFSFFLKNVPKLRDNLPLIVFILNIFLPGIGTLVAAFYCDDDDVLTFNAVSALLQFITAFIIIGWIWSIAWGYLLLCLSFAQNRHRIKKVRRFEEAELYNDMIKAEYDEFIDDIPIDENEFKDDYQDVEYENCIEYRGGRMETYTPRRPKEDRSSFDESSTEEEEEQHLSFNPYAYYKSLLDQDLNYLKFYGDKVNTQGDDSQYSQIAKKYANNLANHAKYLYKYRTFAPVAYRKYILQVYEYSKRVVEVAKVRNWNGYMYYLNITIEYYRKIDVLEQIGFVGTNYVQTNPVATYYGASDTPNAYFSSGAPPAGALTATSMPMVQNPAYYPNSFGGYGGYPVAANNYNPYNYGYPSTVASYYPANYNYGYPPASYNPVQYYQQPVQAFIATKGAQQPPPAQASASASSEASANSTSAQASASATSTASNSNNDNNNTKTQKKKLDPIIEQLEKLNSQVSSHVGEFNDDASNPKTDPFTFEYLV